MTFIFKLAAKKKDKEEKKTENANVQNIHCAALSTIT